MLYYNSKEVRTIKRENTSIRLKSLMKERNLRQIDILNLTKPYCIKYDVKMNRSDISQYVSGKVEPNQDKLVILGMALDVNEAWLMGYNVNMNRKDLSGGAAENDFELLNKFSQLVDEDQKLVMNLIDTLLRKGEGTN